MNQDDIIRMAREQASATVDYDFLGQPITDADVMLMGAFGPLVVRLVTAAVIAEREACAKVFEEAAARLTTSKRTNQVDRHVADVLERGAAAIRARGKA